jgi:hypothetical protein
MVASTTLDTTRRLLGMGRDTYQPEQIIAKLREEEILLTKGQPVVKIIVISE